MAQVAISVKALDWSGVRFRGKEVPSLLLPCHTHLSYDLSRGSDDFFLQFSGVANQNFTPEKQKSSAKLCFAIAQFLSICSVESCQATLYFCCSSNVLTWATSERRRRRRQRPPQCRSNHYIWVRQDRRIGWDSSTGWRRGRNIDFW